MGPAVPFHGVWGILQIQERLRPLLTRPDLEEKEAAAPWKKNMCVRKAQPPGVSAQAHPAGQMGVERVACYLSQRC